MLKYAKIINEETKTCDVGLGTNIDFYKSLGFTEQEVEQAYDGQWYLKGYAPTKPAPTIAEQVLSLENEYKMNRWQREGILAEGSLYSEYTKNKAQEIENIAEQIRG